MHELALYGDWLSTEADGLEAAQLDEWAEELSAFRRAVAQSVEEFANNSDGGEEANGGTPEENTETFIIIGEVPNIIADDVVLITETFVEIDEVGNIISQEVVERSPDDGEKAPAFNMDNCIIHNLNHDDMDAAPRPFAMQVRMMVNWRINCVSCIGTAGQAMPV